MSVKLLTERKLEFISLKGGCTGSSESTLVEMPHCWKSRVAAHIAEWIMQADIVLKVRGSNPSKTAFSFYIIFVRLFLLLATAKYPKQLT